MPSIKSRIDHAHPSANDSLHASAVDSLFGKVSSPGCEFRARDMQVDIMNKQELPDRITAKLTIELDFAKEDQPLIGEVLQNIIDSLGFSSSGNGSRTMQSHYSYKLESNVPSEPMTMDHLLDLADQAIEPGEPTARERLAESMHPDYEEADAWWEGLTEPQREWFINKYPNAKLVTVAWAAHKQMDFADRVVFQALK